MKYKSVFLRIVVAVLVAAITILFIQTQVVKAQRVPGHGGNFQIVIAPENQPEHNRCPSDKPYLLVKAWADFKGTATDESLCQNPGGDSKPCISFELGYGDRSLGPGLISECVSEPGLP